MKDAIAKIEKEFSAKLGGPQIDRLVRGMRQVASLWREEDGDARAFEQFVRENFAGTQAALDTMFERLKDLFEKLDGHLHEINRNFREHSDLDAGPIEPYDDIFAGYDPSAHIADDFFANKLAFVVLLNFPLTTLKERLAEGEGWSRRQWAEVRLAGRFADRIPAGVNLEIARAQAAADHYVSEYNIWMHHLLDQSGGRPFPPGLRLISHWDLRDQIKAEYANAKDGLARQRLIELVMERIILQTIPRAVIDNPHVDWNPYTGEVSPTNSIDAPGLAPAGMEISNSPEPDTRYAMILGTFHAARKADPYCPMAPTHIDRRFDEDREIPEARVKAMLDEVLSSPLVPRVAKLIEKRLGRQLEPFDIWYSGFRPRASQDEARLNETVRSRYPTLGAFHSDIPNILAQMGFTADRAKFLSNNIAVDPVRGSGHAMGAQMRGEKARLRTPFEKDGMNYKGFNVAMHELGHAVEQTISLNDVDYAPLQGVPNTAFTEAFAFAFQAQDMAILGLAKDDAMADAKKTLGVFWDTYEIAGVARVDMALWHRMYDHPFATPAELKGAVIEIAKDIWNRFYAHAFKKEDVPLLGIYSHMIHSFLYLPDYPMGYLIAHQIGEQMRRAGSIGAEFERMARAGCIAPDLWMKNATGRPVGAGALISATDKALESVGA